MKRILGNIGIVLAALWTTGCYEDKGNYDYKQLPEVTVTGLEESYTRSEERRVGKECAI